MLNEILEFEAYVKSPESEKPRIQPKLLTNNFNEDGNLFGIERILIVIARGYIFLSAIRMKFIILTAWSIMNC